MPNARMTKAGQEPDRRNHPQITQMASEEERDRGTKWAEGFRIPALYPFVPWSPNPFLCEICG